MSTVTPNRLPRRPRLVRNERGQGVVEFALILPVLLLILVGILEFGSIYSNVISIRQGVREAGRQGSVGKILDCLVPSPSPPVTNVTNRNQLICLTKSQAGVQNGVRVNVQFEGNSYVAGNALVICAEYPLQSLTGLFQPFLNGRVARTKAEFRIEKVYAEGLASGQQSGETAIPCAA